MLADHPIDVLLLAKNLDEAKAFNADKVGLPVLSENPHVLCSKCGGDSRNTRHWVACRRLGQS